MNTVHHCPNCGKEMGAGDLSRDAPHQVARRLKELVFPVTFGWTLIILAVLVPIWLVLPGSSVDRGFGWLIICLPAIPGFFLTMLSWLFPKVRVWRCSRCGHVHEVRLKNGRVPLPESHRSGDFPPPPWMTTSAANAPQVAPLKEAQASQAQTPPQLPDGRKLQTGRKPRATLHHCPNCGKEMGSGDASEVVPHRVARKLKSMVFPTVVVWSLLLGATVFAASLVYHPSENDPEETLDWLVLFIGLIPLPWILFSFLAWFFPKMRAWRCGGCGHVHEVRLSRHPSPRRPHRETTPGHDRKQGRKGHRNPDSGRKLRNTSQDAGRYRRSS
jgi:predicted RNA-binding Zn-ribbon protein involved in translation (DUF1610 family)/rubredoxin